MGILTKREPAEAREAHRWVLAAAAALEEQIERLNQSITRDRPDAHIHSQSHYQQRRSQGQSRRHCRALPEDSPVPSPMYSPSWWGPETSEDQEAESSFLKFNLRPPLELGSDIECFFQEPATLQKEGRRSDPFPEPIVENYENWIEWRSFCICTPNWWKELLDDFQELVQKIRASFEILQVRSKAQGRDNNYSALSAPACIRLKDFLPPPDSRLPCRDIREGQSQKTLAYTQALQYWAKKVRLPMPSQPCLLAGCVQELKQMMEEYVALTEDAILEGAVP